MKLSLEMVNTTRLENQDGTRVKDSWDEAMPMLPHKNTRWIIKQVGVFNEDLQRIIDEFSKDNSTCFKNDFNAEIGSRSGGTASQKLALCDFCNSLNETWGKFGCRVTLKTEYFD